MFSKFGLRRRQDKEFFFIVLSKLHITLQIKKKKEEISFKSKFTIAINCERV
jgi:hypothetical protein